MGMSRNPMVISHLSESFRTFQPLAERQDFFQFGDDSLLLGKGREGNRQCLDVCNR